MNAHFLLGCLMLAHTFRLIECGVSAWLQEINDGIGAGAVAAFRLRGDYVETTDWNMYNAYMGKIASRTDETEVALRTALGKAAEQGYYFVSARFPSSYAKHVAREAAKNVAYRRERTSLKRRQTAAGDEFDEAYRKKTE